MGCATTSGVRQLAARWPAAIAGVCLAASLLAVQVRPASAVILPAVTIDGPSEDIGGVGGIAMAEDGSGGVVYLKRAEGLVHVFVARHVAGHWLAPIRVDTGEPFAASWARIGAGEGGELVVTWATPFATENGHPVQELLGATLGPGASGFGPARVIDANIGDGTGTSPDLAMSSTGQADLVYRVVESEVGKASTIPLLRSGDVVESVRVAHYNGTRWSLLGRINRDPGASMRPPTPANAPQIAIGATGNGVVVWQEPEINGVARIWARRLFGTSLDFVLPVSAASLAGAPIGTDADAPSIAVSFLGQAEVAYRQSAGPGSPLSGPRIFLNTLPDGESANGSEFVGAKIVDSGVAGGLGATVGPPSIDIDEQRDLRILYDANGTPRVIEGSGLGLAGALSLGSPFAGSEPIAASVMNPGGGGVSAWPSADRHGDPGVAVREDFSTGAVQTALLSGGSGGEVGELSVGRSGLGDGLVAFRQGALGDAAVVGVDVTAPPKQFALSTPRGWIKPSGLTVSWAPEASASKPIGYQLVLDGRTLPTPAGVLRAQVPTLGLSSGIHQIQVLAIDANGQAVLTPSASVQVDGVPPTVKVVRSRGGQVLVRVSDAFSGVAVHSVRVSFGDGHSAKGRARFEHRYAHAGIYRVSVSASDRLGNRGVVHELVRVR